MLQAGCIYLGLIAPCPENSRPLHPPRRLITPCPTTNAISTKEYPKHPAWLTFPLSLPQTSLYVWSLPDPSRRSAWSLGRLSPLLAWIKVTYFCWGRLSFSAFSASARTIPYKEKGQSRTGNYLNSRPTILKIKVKANDIEEKKIDIQLNGKE